MESAGGLQITQLLHKPEMMLIITMGIFKPRCFTKDHRLQAQTAFQFLAVLRHAERVKKKEISLIKQARSKMPINLC